MNTFHQTKTKLITIMLLNCWSSTRQNNVTERSCIGSEGSEDSLKIQEAKNSNVAEFRESFILIIVLLTGSSSYVLKFTFLNSKWNFVQTCYVCRILPSVKARSMPTQYKYFIPCLFLLKQENRQLKKTYPSHYKIPLFTNLCEKNKRQRKQHLVFKLISIFIYSHDHKNSLISCLLVSFSVIFPCWSQPIRRCFP